MPRKGPLTEAGKHRSSINGIRHGIFCKQFLPCKKEKCFYISLCPYMQAGHGDIFEKIQYAEPCPVERELFNDMAACFESQSGQNYTTEELRDFLILNLQIRRIQMVMCMDPNFARPVPSEFPGYSRSDLALPIKYRREFTSRLLKRVRDFKPSL